MDKMMTCPPIISSGPDQGPQLDDGFFLEPSIASFALEARYLEATWVPSNNRRVTVSQRFAPLFRQATLKKLLMARS